jgi:hypothetical protein
LTNIISGLLRPGGGGADVRQPWRPSSLLGARLTDVVKAGTFMKQLQRDRSIFNEVWADRFGEHRPARCAVQAGDFGRPRETVRYIREVAAPLGGTLSRQR